MPEKRRILRVITRLNVGGPSLQAIDLSCDVPEWETRLVCGTLRSGERDMSPYIGDRPCDLVDLPELVNPIDPARDLAAARRIAALIRDYRPDVLHTHHAKAGLVGRLAAQMAPGPAVIHTFHGNVFRGHFGPLKSALIRFLEQRLAPHADALVAISPRQLDDLADTFRITERERLRLVPLGFHLDRFLEAGPGTGADRNRLGLPENRPLVGIVGRLTHVKNHDFWLNALAALPECDGVIVGDGDLETVLRHRAKTLGIADRIHWLPTQEDVTPVYRALDVLSITSHSEGTPVTMIEAQASGLPVVAAAVGGIPDLAGDGTRALTYIPGNIKDCVNRIRTTLDDTPETERRTRVAQEHVAVEHSFESLVGRLDAVYASVRP